MSVRMCIDVGWRTCHAGRAGLRQEVDDIALLDAAIRQIHLQPQSVAGAGLEVGDECARRRVSLRHFEHARVLLSGVALINRPVDVDVLVFRIRHAAPNHLDAHRLDLGDVDDGLEAVRVDSLTGGDFQPLAHAQLRAMTMERDVEEPNFVGRLGFQVVQRVRRQRPENAAAQTKSLRNFLPKETFCFETLPVDQRSRSVNFSTQLFEAELNSVHILHDVFGYLVPHEPDEGGVDFVGLKLGVLEVLQHVGHEGRLVVVDGRRRDGSVGGRVDGVHLTRRLRGEVAENQRDFHAVLRIGLERRQLEL